jgi:hypothetical protein
MNHADPTDHCPSPVTLQRIAGARWTPYVADTLQLWCRNALAAHGACTTSRPDNCDACRALQKIAELRWSDALGETIQRIAREALGQSRYCKPAAPVALHASA